MLRLLASLILPSTLCSSLVAQYPADTRDSSMVEAANLLQGTDSLPFLSPARVDQVRRSLATVRRLFPQLQDIDVGPDRTLLEVHLADSVNDRMREALRPILPSSGQAPIPVTGLSALDSLNQVLGVSTLSASTVSDYLWGYTLTFKDWPNIPVLGPTYDSLPEVAFASAPLYAGDGSWIALIPKPGTDLYVFSRGGGDCPAGCTERDFYYVSYHLTSGQAQLERVRLHGDTASPTEPVALWDVPTRYSAMPYPDADSLFRAVSSPQWWLRLHALGVLQQLLGPATGPWRGAGEQSPAHFTLLKAQVGTRRIAALRLLIHCLIDPDPDVAHGALAVLRDVTHQTLGGGAVGQQHWYTWLHAQPPDHLAQPSN